MSKSPASVVKEKFGDKAKLVAALASFTRDDMWVARLNDKKGLARVSNAKLLRLFAILSEVKAKFGNRFKLIDAICELEKRNKDEGYRKRLGGYPVARLYDLYKAVGHRKGLKGLGPAAVDVGAIVADVPSAAKTVAKEKKPTPAAAKASPDVVAPRAKKAAAPPVAAEEAKAAPKRKPASEKKDETKSAKKNPK
jgi:hypothetical protein